MQQKRAAAALAAFLFVSGCGTEPAAPSVSVEKAWVRLPAAEGQPAAAYFEVVAKGRDVVLTGIESSAAERAELHESVTQGGVAKMVPLPRVKVPAGETVAFAPGGKHAMVFGLAPDVRPGGTVTLRFTFEEAPPVTAEADVRSIAGGDHSGH